MGWVKGTSQFKEDFIKSYNEKIDEKFFLEVDAQYLKKLHNLHNDLPFLPERIENENVEKFVVNLHDKLNMLYT